MTAPRRPTAAAEYRRGASLTGTEQFGDLLASEVIEVVRDCDVAFEKPESLSFVVGGRIESDDLHQGPAGPGDDEGFPFGRCFDEAREVRLGFVNIDSPRHPVSPED